MKKILFILFFAAISVLVRAGNVVSISSGQGHTGDEVAFTVSLANDDAVSAAEIVIPLGGGITLVDGSATLSDRSNGHVISAAMAGTDLHIYIYSMSLSTLSGNAGELCSFSLKMGNVPGTYSLTPTVVLSDAAGQEVASTAQGGQVTLLAPDLELVTTSVDFGRVPIRGTYTRNVQVRNTGNEPATISEVQFDNPDFSVDNLPITVAAGSTQNVTVTYRPIDRSPGVKSWMTIISDATSGKKKLYVNAIPFSVNELRVQRASGVANTEAEVSIKVNNMEPLVGMQCTFNLPQQLEYVEGSLAIADRTSGSTAFASLDGRKLTLYLYSASNTAWTGDDGVVLTFKVLLNGTSGSYCLNPTDVVLSNITQENMTSATYSEYVVISAPRFSGATTLDMGVTPANEVAQATYTMRNTGQTPLTIDKVVFLADGYEVVEQFPIVIANGQSTSITVRYTPEREGSFATTMNVYTDDPTQRMVPVKVSGEKFAPNTLAIEGEKVDGGYDLHFSMNNWTSDLTAVQMDVHWPAEMTYASVAKGSRLSGHDVMVIPLGDNTWRVLVYSMSNSTIGGTEGELFTMHFTCNTPADYIGTTVTIDGITLSDTRSVDKYSGEDLTYEIPFLLGDVNADGRVNMADVSTLIDYIYGNNPPVFIHKAADTNFDNRYNMADASGIIDIIYGNN